LKKNLLLLVIDNKGSDFAVPKGGATASRIMNIVSAATLAAGKKNVVMAIVDITNDTIALVKRRADGVVRGVLKAVEGGEAKVIRLCPVDEASTCIATVVLQPLVERAGVATIAKRSKIHGDRSDGTTGRADGVGSASSKTVAAPTTIALKPAWRTRDNVFAGIIGCRDSNNNASQSNNTNKTHFFER